MKQEKKTLNILMMSLLLAMVLLVGCQQSSENDNEIMETLEVLTEEHEAMTEKMENLTQRVSALEENRDMLLRLLDEQVTILSGELGEEYTILPIYHLDIDTYDQRAQYYTMIPKELDLQEQVQQLADKLSRYAFDGLPIKLITIETSTDNQLIAVINLIDPEDRSMPTTRKTWAGNYFQGSSGGYATVTKLLGTFLQEEYDGEWIDGVKFLYNGDETNQFEHIGDLLGKVYAREEIR